MTPVHKLPPVLVILTCFVIVCNGTYVITTPREWLPGSQMQMCVQVPNPRAPPGHVDIGIISRRRRVVGSGIGFGSLPPLPPPPGGNVEEVTDVLLKPLRFVVPQGNQHLCDTIPLPEVSRPTNGFNRFGSGTDFISVIGNLDGVTFNHTGRLTRQSNRVKTIIQTDKYLYKPRQTVQFRILSHRGPGMEILTEPYKEIYVTTPSNNRIAQWLNVDNSKGLVHLSMQLADEPEEGIYTIVVNNENAGSLTSSFSFGRDSRTSFKVEEFVLPRFEVTVEGPKSIRGTKDTVSFSACAEYTFGEPVRGEISWEISNSMSFGCRVVYTKNDTISGCNTITVASSELRLSDCQVSFIRATATVTEHGTGAQEEGQGSTRVARNAITFKTLRKDDYIKPNLPYTLKVLAESPDGSPAAGALLEVCHGNACHNLTTPDNGIIEVYLTNRDSKQVVIQSLITRAVMRVSRFSTQIEKFYSPSNSSLIIYTPENSLKCASGQETSHVLPVLFAAVNQRFAIVNVQVMSRGQIQYFKSATYELSPSRLPFDEDFLIDPFIPTSQDVVIGVINIPIELPATASPVAKVLVWYIRDDGEVVSDAKELKVDKCLPNRVDLSWSTNRTEPGRQATWTISSAPDSICSLGVVDKSVELLSSDRQDPLTVDTFFVNNFEFDLRAFLNPQADDQIYCRRLLETEIKDIREYNYYSDYVDTLHMFDKSGLYIFTDLNLETRPCNKEKFENQFFAFGSGGGFGGGSIPIRANAPPVRNFSPGISSQGFSAESSSGGGGGAEPRTDFPETWLWDLVLVPSSGQVGQDLPVPDTITEWAGRAVCVHPEKGVGLSERASLTTFTPFFVDLTLPPSIKRGEVLPVKISVFNYLEQPLPVRISLEPSPEYEFVSQNSAGGLPINQRESCVESRRNQVHTIKIKPNVIGEVKITVLAFVNHQSSLNCGSRSSLPTKRDALVRPITVEAEGFLREKSWSKYICADEIASGEDSLERLEVSLPPGIVEGSERGWVTAVGDLLAISLQHLGNLIRLPYGCGEQNLVNFAPNIYILQYLRATRQETPEARDKLVRFMATGYQRQLLYRHDNGSYSAFGKADDSGSTWLTAFVLKSFSQAKQFILIDEEKRVQTGDWLLDNYGNNTCITAIGKVFNKGMKGGLSSKGSSPVPLTAYVVISLLESELSPNHATIQKGIQCILNDDSSDSYTLALKAYALALAKSPRASAFVEQLLRQATTTHNSTHWELPRGSVGSKALEVETAGYAILAMMALDPEFYRLTARKVVKWISTQRNGRGGFYSTQDTVVALQALASFESNLFQGDLDVVARVQAQGLDHSFNIKETNKLVTQQVSLPVLPTFVTFSMAGQGCAVLQTVLRYNDLEPEASDAFSLRVNSRTEPDNFCVTKRISACATYLLPDGISNMAVLEVNLVSGYIPEKDDLKKIVKDNTGVIKRYDVDGNKVSFYIEEFKTNDICVNFRVIRQVDIENAKPGTVVVYDYYQPEFSVSKTYNLPVASQCFLS